MKKGKIVVFLLVIMMTVSLFPGISAAEAADSGDYTYTDNGNGTCTITAYSGSGGNVTIPSELDDLAVTAIGASAFNSCANLTGVTIPDGVTSIGDHAFFYCFKLVSAAIPDGVTSISDYAFSQCERLASVDIPESVTTIGMNSFSLCYALTGIALPSQVTSIGEAAFAVCTALTSITIPSKVASIGDHAFISCGSMSAMYFDGSMPTIGDAAFENCSNLTYYCPTGNAGGITLSPLTQVDTQTIAVSADNGTITASTYAGMPGETVSLHVTPDTGYLMHPGSLKYNDQPISGRSFTMPASAVTVTALFEQKAISVGSQNGTIIEGTAGTATFNANAVIADGEAVTVNWCDAGGSAVSAPAGLSASGSAVSGRSATITVSADNTAEAGTYTFTAAADGVTSGVVTVTIAAVKASGDYFYADNGGGTCIIAGYSGTGGDIAIPAVLDGLIVTAIGKNAFNSKTSLTGVTIPYGVASIGESAFADCTALTGAAIPNTVAEIGINAFIYTGLTSVTIPASVTSIDSGAFAFCDSLTAAYFDGTPKLSTITFYHSYSVNYCVPAGVSFYVYNAAGDYSYRATNLSTFSITADAANGAIMPSTVSGMPGETISLHTVPDTGYALQPGSLKYHDGSGDHTIRETSFTMPEGAVTVSADFIDDSNIMIVVGDQNGTIFGGKAGLATFAAAAMNIDTGTAVTVNWCDENGAALSSAPTGLSASGSVLSSNRSLITVEATASAAVGTYYFKASCAGNTSNRVTVTVLKEYFDVDVSDHIYVSSGTAGNNAAHYGENYEIYLKADFQTALLPDTIAVTIGDNEAASGTDYIWDSSDGHLYIYSSIIIGDITITAETTAYLPTYVEVGGLTLYSATASDIDTRVSAVGTVYKLSCSEAFIDDETTLGIDEGGSGTASYDSSTGTLTFNSAVVPYSSKSFGFFSRSGDLRLVLSGDSVFGIEGSENTICDFCVSSGSVLIESGSDSDIGSLTLYSFNAEDWSYGLEADNDIFFKSGSYEFIGSGSSQVHGFTGWRDVFISGGTIACDITGSDYGYGIYSGGGLTVSGGSVVCNVIGSSCGYGVYSSSKDITVSGGSVISNASTFAMYACTVTYDGINKILYNTNPAVKGASTATGALADLSGIVFDSSSGTYTDSAENPLTAIKIGILSSEKAITAFSLAGAEGTVNENDYTIAVTLLAGTDLTSLSPAITASPGASVLPAGGTAEDFTNPVTYTVTAENGTTRTYTVTVTLAAAIRVDSMTDLGGVIYAAMYNSDGRMLRAAILDGGVLSESDIIEGSYECKLFCLDSAWKPLCACTTFQIEN